MKEGALDKFFYDQKKEKTHEIKRINTPKTKEGVRNVSCDCIDRLYRGSYHLKTTRRDISGIKYYQNEYDGSIVEFWK